MQNLIHKQATVIGGHYDGQIGTITRIEKRAGEWRAIVEFSDGGGFWYLPEEFTVITGDAAENTADHDNPMTWSADQIRHAYDSDFDMRLRDLAMMTGRTIAALRRILRA